MIVLSHRGYWKSPAEKNLEIAFKRSFDLAFGTETDIRDHAGSLVISHDMPNGTEMKLIDFLQLLNEKDLPLALNIKADGLALELKNILDKTTLQNHFVFDMAVPDMRAYLDAGIPVFTRMSEVEQSPAWLERSTGIWLDAFSDIWYDVNLIETLLNRDKKVCVVSAELHGRKAAPLWELLLPLSNHPGLMLCTDFPEEARTYFGEKI